LLSLKRAKVIQAAEKYFSGDERVSAVAVISGEERLKAVNETHPEEGWQLHKI
jgi:hypothetical protein